MLPETYGSIKQQVNLLFCYEMIKPDCKEVQTKRKSIIKAFKQIRLFLRIFLRPPEPEAVGSNPALPKSNSLYGNMYHTSIRGSSFG